MLFISDDAVPPARPSPGRFGCRSASARAFIVGLGGARPHGHPLLPAAEGEGGGRVLQRVAAVLSRAGLRRPQVSGPLPRTIAQNGLQGRHAVAGLVVRGIRPSDDVVRVAGVGDLSCVQSPSYAQCTRTMSLVMTREGRQKEAFMSSFLLYSPSRIFGLRQNKGRNGYLSLLMWSSCRCSSSPRRHSYSTQMK